MDENNVKHHFNTTSDNFLARDRDGSLVYAGSVRYPFYISNSKIVQKLQ